MLKFSGSSSSLPCGSGEKENSETAVPMLYFMKINIIVSIICLIILFFYRQNYLTAEFGLNVSPLAFLYITDARRCRWVSDLRNRICFLSYHVSLPLLCRHGKIRQTIMTSLHRLTNFTRIKPPLGQKKGKNTQNDTLYPRTFDACDIFSGIWSKM